jgi:hypothetical protein
MVAAHVPSGRRVWHIAASHPVDGAAQPGFDVRLSKLREFVAAMMDRRPAEGYVGPSDTR